CENSYFSMHVPRRPATLRGTPGRNARALSPPRTLPMRPPLLSLLALALLTLPASPARDKDKPPRAPEGRLAQVDKRVAAELPSLEALYKQLHANPELSLHEVQTAARLARELKKLG